jgi:diguanylate cyclase (GGDEF)-like protein
MHPDDVALAQRARVEFGSGERQQLHADRRLVTKTGAVVHVIVSTVPVRDDHGALSHYLTHLVDVTEQRRRHDELSFLADHDPLTGLVNRRGFEVALRACPPQGDHASPPALLMIDLDRFKQVNDVHGHALGDLLITRVAEIITSVAGPGLVVGRIGGDEFVVLIPSATRESAATLAQQLVDAIGTMPGGEVAFTDGRVGASIGIAIAPAGDIDGPRLLVRADRALYQAKRAGRGAWALASDE